MPETRSVSSTGPGSGTHGLKRGSGGSKRGEEPEGTACATNSREKGESEGSACAENLRNDASSGGLQNGAVTVGAIGDETDSEPSGVEVVAKVGEVPQCRGCSFYQKQVADLVKELREDDAARYKEEAKVATAKVQRLKGLLAEAAVA